MKHIPVFGTLAVAFAMIGIGGCTRAPEPQFVSSEAVLKLDAAAQDQVRLALRERCGTAKSPLLPGDDGAAKRLKRGGEVYTRRCVQCHGVTGDGAGPAAATLRPRPRDYRKGVFKFTSTPFGSRPRHEDLVSTVRRGIVGTSMPSFDLLPKEEIEAVVDYVTALSVRGELEAVLALEAPDLWDEAKGEKQAVSQAAEKFADLLAKTADEQAAAIVKRWKDAELRTVVPLTPQPEFTAERIARGREFFLDKAAGCNKCHGADGRGQTPDNLRGDLKDAWGHPLQAADLTSGMLRGGSRPVDVYRRVYSGINGTPMPSFANIFAKEPDRVWDVVAFVMSISNERRRGVVPKAAIAPMADHSTASASTK